MKAIVIHRHGKPAALKYEDIPAPVCAEGQLLVKVEAAGVNYADTLLRRGRYPSPSPLPVVPGFEICGTVESFGADVTGFAVGQRVIGLAMMGGYAEQCVIPASAALPLPAGLTPLEGAAFPVNFLTAYFTLRGAGGELRAGQSVLLHAAAGGVGIAAVQLARLMGARVLATASTDEKLALVKGLGAEVCINYARDDFAKIVREHTGGRGVDVIMETVGGEVFDRNFRCLAPLGRVVIVGCASGKVRHADSIRLLFNGHTVAGLHLRHFTAQTELMEEATTTLLRWLQSGQMKIVVGETHPLAEAAMAHRRMEARQTHGKIVLLP